MDPGDQSDEKKITQKKNQHFVPFMTITIFNSWQSDSPFNSRGIRTALRDSCNKLESQFAGLHIRIDEATSNQIGSLHIPSSILQNISEADVFVVDLSTVGSTFDGKRKLQNPNVLIEVGYAISQLGWNRIVLLFNKVYGEFTDLPFDIEKRSCLDFKISNETDRNGIAQLRDSLTSRLADIIETDPEKPTLKTIVVDKKRENDINTIKRILIWFPVLEMDIFFKEAPDKVKRVLAKGGNELNDLTESLAFHVADQRLRRRILALYNAWQDMFERMKKTHTLKGNEYISNTILGGRKSRTQITNYIVEDIAKGYSSFLNYVRKEYPEVDI